MSSLRSLTHIALYSVVHTFYSVYTGLLEYMYWCVVHGASIHVVAIGTSLSVVNCTTMCSMNLLQAPNQHHFEVLIGVHWITCIIEDSP